MLLLTDNIISPKNIFQAKTFTNWRNKMKKEKIILGLTGIAFIAGFLFAFNPYLAAEEQLKTKTTIEDIPLNAVLVKNVKNQSVGWQDKVYEPWELKPVIIPCKDYFTTMSMDRINFSISHKIYENGAIAPDIIVFFVRGIQYDKLPFVYDYKREIDLEPADTVYKRLNGDFRIKLYTLKKFKVSEIAPWSIEFEYQKIDLVFEIIQAVSFGILLGFVVAYIAIVFLSFYGHYFKRKQ